MTLAHTRPAPAARAVVPARPGPAALDPAGCPLHRPVPRATIIHQRSWTGVGCAPEHLVVGSHGVVVLGVATADGMPVGVQVVGGMIAPRHAELVVQAQVRDDLVERVELEASLVVALLRHTGWGTVRVRPLLWLAGSRLPSMCHRLRVGDTAVAGGRQPPPELGQRGPLDALARYRVTTLLADHVGHRGSVRA